MNPQQISVVNAYMDMFKRLAIEMKDYTNLDVRPYLELMREKIDSLPGGFYAGEEDGCRKKGPIPKAIAAEIKPLLHTPTDLGLQKFRYG